MSDSYADFAFVQILFSPFLGTCPLHSGNAFLKNSLLLGIFFACKRRDETNFVKLPFAQKICIFVAKLLHFQKGFSSKRCWIVKSFITSKYKKKHLLYFWCSFFDILRWKNHECIFLWNVTDNHQSTVLLFARGSD